MYKVKVTKWGQFNATIWFMSVSLLLFSVISRRLLISMGLWYCIITRIVCTQLVLFVYRLLWYLDNHSNHRVIVLHRERDKRINKHSDWHGKRHLLLLILEYNTNHKPHVFQTDSRHTTGYVAATRVRDGSVHTPLRVVVLSQVALESGRYGSFPSTETDSDPRDGDPSLKWVQLPFGKLSAQESESESEPVEKVVHNTM